AGAQGAELGQVFGRPVKGPGSASRAEQFAGVRADEAGQAQALVEGVNARRTAGAGQVKPFEADVAGGGQDCARDAPLVPGGLLAVGAAAARRLFFGLLGMGLQAGLGGLGGELGGGGGGRGVEGGGGRAGGGVGGGGPCGWSRGNAVPRPGARTGVGAGNGREFRAALWAGGPPAERPLTQ